MSLIPTTTHSATVQEQIALLQEELSLLIATEAPHSRIRGVRMQIARRKGTHTKPQWEELKSEFDNRCVKCGRCYAHLDKDHIIPVYQGGSDGLDNIQPLCAWCNAAKGSEAYNWAEHRRKFGFDCEVVS